VIGFFKKRLLRAEKVPNQCLTHSQCGEDVIVEFLLNMLGISPGKYLDLGANHPVNFNNTYKFYEKGFDGVLVEADSDLADEIRKVRPRDICVAKAVGVTFEKEVNFFKMTANTLSTTVRETVDRYEKESEHRLDMSNIVSAIEINQLLEMYFPDRPPNFVSLDVEGLDLILIQGWDFNRWRPPVFCVETLTYTQSGKAEKVKDIFIEMDSAGYALYADTYINSIFVSKTLFVPAS
jgi:hypothetical protein